MQPVHQSFVNQKRFFFLPLPKTIPEQKQLSVPKIESLVRYHEEDVPCESISENQEGINKQFL